MVIPIENLLVRLGLFWGLAAYVHKLIHILGIECHLPMINYL